MSARLIERSYHEKIVEYSYVYEYEDEPGCGFSFDCDQKGNIKKKDNEHWMANYNACLAGVNDRGEKILDLGVRRNERTVWNPAVYKCECGEKFWGDGDSKCMCGRWYNAGGQELDAHAMVCSAYAAGYDCMCGENE